MGETRSLIKFTIIMISDDHLMQARSDLRILLILVMVMVMLMLMQITWLSNNHKIASTTSIFSKNHQLLQIHSSQNMTNCMAQKHQVKQAQEKKFMSSFSGRVKEGRRRMWKLMIKLIQRREKWYSVRIINLWSH